MKPEIFINNEFQASNTNTSGHEIIVCIQFNQDGAPYCTFPLNSSPACDELVNNVHHDYTMSDCGYAESFPLFGFCELES